VPLIPGRTLEKLTENTEFGPAYNHSHRSLFVGETYL
jgi:hypothetical protein